MDKVSDTGLIERLRYIADTDDGRFSGIDHTLNEAADEIAAAQDEIYELRRKNVRMFELAELAEAQRDKLAVVLKWLDASGGLGLDKHAIIREALKECGK